MRNKFDRELDNLNAELINMGALCEEGMNSAVSAIFEEDEAKRLDLVKKAEDSEREIDQMERDIEALCMKLLLQQQPVARDLRIVSSALKMISDMERVGDQAQDIAEIVQYMAKEEIPSKDHLRNMADFAVNMLSSSINAFVEQNVELARKVILDDDIVDNFFAKVKADLIQALTEVSRSENKESYEEDTSYGQFLLDILMIAKYIERVGDHATNIAEWVCYGLTGMHPEEKN